MNRHWAEAESWSMHAMGPGAPLRICNKAGLTVTDRMTSMTRTINGTVGVSAPAAQHVGNVVFTLNSRASLHTLRLLNDPCLELTFIGP